MISIIRKKMQYAILWEANLIFVAIQRMFLKF